MPWGVAVRPRRCPVLFIFLLCTSWLGVLAPCVQLAYKVTDVAMLALGERCHSLTDVNLSGCTFLTDAGIEWLTHGCHQLITLKLPGLYKLTDTGTRRCRALRLAVAAGSPLSSTRARACARPSPFQLLST